MAEAESCTIHVYLFDEGVDVWRPVEAERLGGDLYRITSEVQYEERWEFTTGEIVRCISKVLSGGECLVAVARVAPEQAQ